MMNDVNVMEEELNRTIKEATELLKKIKALKTARESLSSGGGVLEEASFNSVSELLNYKLQVDKEDDSTDKIKFFDHSGNFLFGKIYSVSH